MRDETIVTIINHPDDTGAHRRPKEACLVVISGTDLGRKYTIGPREMTLGRATTSDICISQDSVSRTHAKKTGRTSRRESESVSTTRLSNRQEEAGQSLRIRDCDTGG